MQNVRELLQELLQELLRTSPILLACLLPALFNLCRRERAHQYFMPILALLFCIPAALILGQMIGWLENLLDQLVNFLASLPVVGFRFSQWATSVLRTMRSGARLEFWQNILLLAAFCVLKLIFRPIVKRLWDRFNWLTERTAWVFYLKRKDRVTLRQKYSDLRKIARILFIASVVLAWVDCALVCFNVSNPFFAFPYYPVFGVILLGEIFYFLNGKTADETGLPGEDEPEEEEAECGVILSALKETFGDRLGYSDKQPTPILYPPEEDWYAALSGGDELDQVTAAYYKALEESVGEIEPDYVIAANRLIHGGSLLICNPFYKDMSGYITLPVFHALLNHRSCLIICGRNTNERDVREWISTCMTGAAGLRRLWSVELLDGVPRDEEPIDIGILSFERIFDLNNLKENQAFFRNVSLVILLEPSNLLGTGQIGLRTVLQFCESGGKTLTYCILDRNADGLVDALSHALRQSITEVIASPSVKSGYCRAFWQAEGPGLQTRLFPSITHYMGLGGELSVLAAHEGSGPMHWYSGSKIPLTDLKWNFEQYYYPICRYLDMADDQIELGRQFHFHESLWQADFGPRSFVLVEDEFCNAFEMERAFGARVRQKGFINILSESYLLRDYMYNNQEIFTNDPKAIPSIAPDYARTERNFVLRTLMLMAIHPIDESDLSNELALHGIETSLVSTTFRNLVIRHTDLEDPKITTRPSESGKTDIAGCTRYSYIIDQAEVDSVFDAALRNAYFIIENEQTNTYLMGNRLMDHVEQVLLPGQFFSYDGRAYQVRSISREHGIVVRRAADHLTGRLYYRQFRNYTLSPAGKAESDRLASFDPGSAIEVKDLRGIRVERLFANVKVRTPAYLEMAARSDLPGACFVELDDRTIRERKLHHKEILRLEIPDASPEVRYTLGLLLNELFLTVYSNEYSYITAFVTDIPEKVKCHPDFAKKLAALVPTAEVNEAKPNAIYIVEDSNIDLGLLISFERNLQRFLEILADYLSWYLDPDRDAPAEEKPGGGLGGEPESGDGEESADDGSSQEGETPDDGKKSGKRGLFKRLREWLARKKERLYRKRKAADMSDPAYFDQVRSNHAGDDVDGEDEQVHQGGGGARRWDHKHRFEYLSFGYSEKKEPEWLALAETLHFLKEKSFLDSNLHRTHVKDKDFDNDSDYDPNKPGTHYCDFCGTPLKPGEYTVLMDGRERCPECSKDAVRSKKQFKQVYMDTVNEMEQVFGIRFKNPIKARMSNARKVNEGMNTYKPSPRCDTRVLGYTQGNLIMVENGAPLWKMKQTLVHEMTHVWQGENWDSSIMAKYNRDERIATVIEGMAVWAEIQYLLSMGKKELAVMYKRNRDYDTSVYGTGMKLFLDRYPPREKRVIDLSRTPFGKFPPV